MTADQITDSATPLHPRAQAAAALARLLARHPHLADSPILATCVEVDGSVYVSAGVNEDGAITAMRELAQKIGGEPQAFRYNNKGTPRVSLSVDTDFDGVRWHAVAFMDAAAYDFDAFIRDHNPDPQEWTEQERAEYADLAHGSAAAA